MRVRNLESESASLLKVHWSETMLGCFGRCACFELTQHLSQHLSVARRRGWDSVGRCRLRWPQGEIRNVGNILSKKLKPQGERTLLFKHPAGKAILVVLGAGHWNPSTSVWKSFNRTQTHLWFWLMKIPTLYGQSNAMRQSKWCHLLFASGTNY